MKKYRFEPLTRPAAWALRGVMVVAAAALVGCASPAHRAPVEDRQAPRPASTAAAPAATAPAPAAVEAPTAKLPPGAENAGKAGFYTIKPGDTLIRIGLDNGQNWRDIARWNGIDNPNLIEVGQVLRVVPLGAADAPPASSATTRPVVVAGRAEARPLEAPASAPAAAAPATAPAPAPAPMPPPAREGDDDIGWAWPASGPVSSSFDEGKNKGLAIAGKAGDPVLAAADGRVVYAGSGLRGYGNLIIVKHNATYLTAYAHNQALLVREDQVVRRGQRIAEMGSSDTDGVKLHFEIRRQGKPVDPARLLPPR